MEESGRVSPYQFCRGRSINEMMSNSHPRYVLDTNVRWMESYCSLDEGELQHRDAAVLRHAEGFALWMGVLSLFHSAFSHTYTTPSGSLQAQASNLFRLELLMLAGGNVKLALDAALAGYYSGCMALERHMLETWRRVAYVRLHPEDIWCWIPQSAWPKEIVPVSDDFPVEKGGMPTKVPKADRIGKVIETRGDDLDKAILDLVRSGFDTLSEHAHPSFEGAAQTRIPGTLLGRYFGPTYEERQAIECIEWGLIAGCSLLTEVSVLAGPWPEWDAHLDALKVEIGRWREGDKVTRR